MNKTGIEYLTHTWNPLAMRCTKVSPACDNCWHLRTADRLKNNKKLNWRIRTAYAGEGDPVIVKSRLEEPSNRKKPSIIGVQFMGDLLHEKIDFHKGVDAVMAEMENAPWHTFIILTKRTERLFKYHKYLEYENTDGSNRLDTSNWEWPKHIWPGATIENQEQALKRLPYLLSIPSAVHLISVEPMLSELNLTHLDIDGARIKDPAPDMWFCQLNALTGKHDDMGRPCPDRPKLDWVIAGCESGGNRRPSKIEWFRNLRNQCVNVGVPFFLKQMEINGKVVSMPELDGKVWKQWPEIIK